jgi:hypothetical protein
MIGTKGAAKTIKTDKETFHRLTPACFNDLVNALLYSVTLSGRLSKR